MEEKRELNLEEMEKISGGIHDQKENRRYEIFWGDEVNCPYCQAVLDSNWDLSYHIKSVHPEHASGI